MGDGQPRLLDEVRDRIRRKHYSIRTEQAYVDWIRASCCITTRGTPATWGRRRSSFDALRANHRERREFSATRSASARARPRSRPSSQTSVSGPDRRVRPIRRTSRYQPPVRLSSF